MPKIPMTENEFKKNQDEIVKASFNIIAEEGYDNISMRKIASSLNISATKIYNYFKNKDEIYLRVMILGYEQFYQYIHNKTKVESDELSKIRRFLEAIVDFYYEKQNFYNLLFIHDVPSVEDYSGNTNFHLALLRRDSGVKFFNLLSDYLKEYLLNRGITRSDQWINNKTILIISQIHGALCIHNNHLLAEVTDAPDKVITSSIDFILNSLDL